MNHIRDLPHRQAGGRDLRKLIDESINSKVMEVNEPHKGMKGI